MGNSSDWIEPSYIDTKPQKKQYKKSYKATTTDNLVTSTHFFHINSFNNAKLDKEHSLC